MNSDGGGYAFNNGEHVVFSKGFMTFEAYWNAIQGIIGKRDLVLHFRKSTNSTVNRQQTHPFFLSNTKKLDGIVETSVIFMNGLIANQVLYDDMNDTQSYIKDHKQAFEVINQDVLNLIKSDTGCKWCVVTSDNIILSDGFIESDGKYYSNLNHKDQEYIPYNPDLIGKRIMSPHDIIDKPLLDEIIIDTDLYEDIEHYVHTRCRYQDVCEWCRAHCLYNLKTMGEIKKFYMNYIDENSTGNIRW